MRYPLILFFLLMMCSTPAMAQEAYKKHKVEKGETVADVAKKYKVTPYDIYRLNPDSKNGIKPNSILLIPRVSKTEATVPAKEQTSKVANTIHEVQAKETLYSLSKKYNVPVDDIKKANGESVAAGLQIGQKVIIPIKGSAVAAQVKKAETAEAKTPPPSYFYHTVAAGETKYSIAKQYGMTLQLLEALNPEVKDTLSIGAKLKLDKNAVVAKETQPAPVVQAVPATTVMAEYIIYKVQPKETFYGITKRTGLTEEVIIALNPDAKEGLREGMELRLPKGTNVTTMADRQMGDLAKTIKKSGPKEIALLLPFNITKAESDSVRKQRLRSEKFLNMTLDFYAGALMAIDSAKTLGLPLKVRILDSKESKSTSDITALRSSLSGTNAVIGPFFQGNVEAAADLLPGIPVISPLSKESGKAFTNLYQSVPSPERVKAAMLDYLRAKDANVIAVVDAKKASSKLFMKNNYAEIRFVEGAVTDASVRNLLVKDKMNYVIMETESTSMVLNTTKVLTTLLADYQIQLVVLEKTETLDYDEVPLERLSGLRMLYPSITKDNETPEAFIFNKVFKQKNGIFPNQFATRGFDVTFDVILRLFQEEGFVQNMASTASEQVENKFIYENINGGNYNSGVYIMYYDTDLSIKQAQ